MKKFLVLVLFVFAGVFASNAQYIEPSPNGSCWTEFYDSFSGSTIRVYNQWGDGWGRQTYYGNSGVWSYNVSEMTARNACNGGFGFSTAEAMEVTKNQFEKAFGDEAYGCTFQVHMPTYTLTYTVFKGGYSVTDGSGFYVHYMTSVQHTNDMCACSCPTIAPPEPNFAE